MKIVFPLIVVALGAVMSSCDRQPSTDSIDRHDRQKQEALLQEGAKQTGMPDIHNFFEKKFLKMALELRDNPKAINYEYVYCPMTGKYTYIGRCVGLGLSFATEYTNPQKVVHPDAYDHYIIMPQADPNGLWAPSSDEGTIIAEINPKTHEIEVTRAEEQTRVSQHKLRASIVMNPKDQEEDDK